MKILQNLLILIIFLVFGGFILKLFIKFLPYILLLIIFSHIINSNKKLVTKIKDFFITEKQFVSQPGCIYKQCSFCDKKADRKAKKCNNCGREL